MPGGLLLLGVVVLVESGGMIPAQSSLNFLYYSVLAAGTLLAWRFQSSRIFLALATVFLAQSAMASFSAVSTPAGGSGKLALEWISLLLPANFVLFSLMSERGFTVPAVIPPALLIFVQSVVVAVLCRPESAPLLDAHATETAHSTSLLPAAWFCFAIAGVVLLVRFVLLRKPAESALFWALLAVLLALYHRGGGRISMAYFAAAVGILAIAIVETSYLLAYHDELTALPARRAFNAALERLEEPYSIAMVDIDHFKRFNDTHGHDVGDQVLQLVASKLARVSGDGQAYRCGGEEFAILFPRKTTAEVLEHLEQLRMAIESAVFRTRGGDRRQVSRGPDRRRQRSPRARRPSPIQAPRGLSVTVSIGVAASSKARSHPDQVIEAADKALYRAKAAGRNRVESAASSGRKIRQKATGIA